MWSVDGRIHTSLISCPISHWSPLFRARKLAYFVLMIVWIISCFFPAKICLFQHRFCWRSDFCLVPLPGCNVSTNAVEIQIANPNIDWLYLHMLHVPTVCVPSACTHMGRPISQSKSIHLSQPFVCLLSPSICVFHIFVYDVGTLPKTARVFMHMHMAAAIVEVPVCTASYLQLCSSKVPSQEKRKGKLALFYF